jgi:uncharacterized protein (TIGR00251 family)
MPGPAWATRPARRSRAAPDDAAVILTITVKPNARDSVLAQDAEGRWSARLRAPPVDGKANAALLALVAAHFGCPPSKVRLVGGAGSRTKRVDVAIP